jgi:hypothetical protein
MDLTGEWDVTIKTPIGSLAVVYSFADDGTGTATGRGETVPLRDIVVAGQRVTWRGPSAGRLPRSAVTGVRRQGRIAYAPS